MDAHKNLATSLVATAPSPASSGTSLVVTASQGTRFPDVPFNASIGPDGEIWDPANCEIVRVTAIATDTLTITRAQEGTSARTVVVGDRIVATITAKTLTDVEDSVVMELISDTVLGSAASSFDIQSIPATYKHLLLILNARGDNGSVLTAVSVRFNNDSGSNYDWARVFGTSASGASQTFAAAQMQIGEMPCASATANRVATIEAKIADYANALFSKSIASHGGHVSGTGTAGNLLALASFGEWRTTSAIDRIQVFPAAGNFVTGSRCTLYGLN